MRVNWCIYLKGGNKIEFTADHTKSLKDGEIEESCPVFVITDASEIQAISRQNVIPSGELKLLISDCRPLDIELDCIQKEYGENNRERAKAIYQMEWVYKQVGSKGIPWQVIKTHNRADTDDAITFKWKEQVME